MQYRNIDRDKAFTQCMMYIQFFFLIFAVIIVCAFFIYQIVDPKGLKKEAKKTREMRSFVMRGEILDRNGIKLAADNTSYDLYAHPDYYTCTENSSEDKSEKKRKMSKEEQKHQEALDKEENRKCAINEISSELSSVLGMTKNDLVAKLSQNFSTITIAKDLGRETGLAIQKLNMRGLDLVKINKRVYPQGDLASHILGYINMDADISSGVERIESKQLDTAPKVDVIEKTATGDVIYDTNTDPNIVTQPLKGNSIKLTIDSAIQHVAEVELDKMIKKTRAKRGTVIALNPKTGELYAFAVLPNYDPNNYKKYSAEVLKNWALSDVYPPGSTFKVLTVASAFQTGYLGPNDTVLDTGKAVIQGWTIKNYDYSKRPYPGDINLEQLFEHSSNIGSLKIALMMPKQIFYNQLRLFGLGQKTGIDLTGESSGIFPKPATWSISNHASMGYGYGVSATPIQMAAAVASIANKGVWVTPHIIKYSPEEYSKRIVKRTTMDPVKAQSLSNILADSIRLSKSDAGKIKHYNVAGKTGTARKPNANGSGYTDGVYTSVVGYFPLKDPKILVMVVVDDPRGCEVWGSTVAGPVFNEVATQAARILKIPPEK